MKLEQLLNNLIEKGWRPFGIYGNWELEWERICIEEQDEYTNEYRNKVYYINVDYVEFNWLYDEDKNFTDKFSIRDMVSKSSGLWQFCCDKWLVEMYEWWYWQNIFPLDSKEYDYTDYQYWILESSLIDEDKLEKFLLENIKVS